MPQIEACQGHVHTSASFCTASPVYLYRNHWSSSAVSENFQNPVLKLVKKKLESSEIQQLPSAIMFKSSGLALFHPSTSYIHPARRGTKHLRCSQAHVWARSKLVLVCCTYRIIHRPTVSSMSLSYSLLIINLLLLVLRVNVDVSPDQLQQQKSATRCKV